MTAEVFYQRVANVYSSDIAENLSGPRQVGSRSTIATKVSLDLLSQFATMTPMNETVAFAKLFIESGVSSDGARAALVRLRRSAELTNAVATVIAEFHRIDDVVNADVATFKRFFRQVEAPNIVTVATLLEHPESAFLRLADQTSFGQNLHPVPFVTGEDLIALGLKPGPAFKKILFDAETQQLNGSVTTKEAALEFVKENL